MIPVTKAVSERVRHCEGGAQVVWPGAVVCVCVCVLPGALAREEPTLSQSDTLSQDLILLCLKSPNDLQECRLRSMQKMRVYSLYRCVFVCVCVYVYCAVFFM